MPEIKTHILIGIKVEAGAREERVEKINESRYHISVKEPAEDNKANSRILEIIQGLYPGKRIRLVSGHRAPSKICEIS